MAARSSFSFGINTLGATKAVAPDEPDGEFFAWLGQMQIAQILPVPERAPSWLQDSQLVSRLDLQLASDPLLAMERIWAKRSVHS